MGSAELRGTRGPAAPPLLSGRLGRRSGGAKLAKTRRRCFGAAGLAKEQRPPRQGLSPASLNRSRSLCAKAATAASRRAAPAPARAQVRRCCRPQGSSRGARAPPETTAAPPGRGAGSPLAAPPALFGHGAFRSRRRPAATLRAPGDNPPWRRGSPRAVTLGGSPRRRRGASGLTPRAVRARASPAPPGALPARSRHGASRRRWRCRRRRRRRRRQARPAERAGRQRRGPGAEGGSACCAQREGRGGPGRAGPGGAGGAGRGGARRWRGRAALRTPPPRGDLAAEEAAVPGTEPPRRAEPAREPAPERPDEQVRAGGQRGPPRFPRPRRRGCRCRGGKAAGLGAGAAGPAARSRAEGGSPRRTPRRRRHPRGRLVAAARGSRRDGRSGREGSVVVSPPPPPRGLRRGEVPGRAGTGGA